MAAETACLAVSPRRARHAGKNPLPASSSGSDGCRLISTPSTPPPHLGVKVVDCIYNKVGIPMQQRLLLVGGVHFHHTLNLGLRETINNEATQAG